LIHEPHAIHLQQIFLTENLLFPLDHQAVFRCNYGSWLQRKARLFARVERSVAGTPLLVAESQRHLTDLSLSSPFYLGATHE
jgi:hypothetical protein